MKITVNQLRRIIKEEVERIVSEKISYNPNIGSKEIGYSKALESVGMVGDENPKDTLQKVADMLQPRRGPEAPPRDPKQVSYTLGKIPHSGMSGPVLLAGEKGRIPTYFFDPMDTEWREIPEESFQ